MRRAAILIGVKKTGDLPELTDAIRGARLMETWAREQGMDPVHLITDELGPVTVDLIKTKIRVLVDAANVSQLLIYFAGHGVNLQRQEYWLLSDAPDDTQAAVNVATSVALGSTCGIPHIILISDACRTAPEGIRSQSLRGSEIFPNREADTTPVDQFFACQLGKPSHEIRDPTVSSSEFKALYTNELVPALMGDKKEIVEWNVGGAQKRIGHIHMRPLRDFMSKAVAARLQDMQLLSRIIQVPVAQISSDPPAWISQFTKEEGFEEEGFRGDTSCSLLAVTPIPIETVATAQSITTNLLRQTLHDGATATAVRAPSVFVDDVLRLEKPFGPMHHESGCGFKLRGARVVDIVSPNIHIEFATEYLPHGYDLRVLDSRRPGSNVLLVLESGAGVLLPAIPEFLCALSFEEDELIDVAYEPSDTISWRWDDYKNRAPEVRSLRAIASSAMVRGSFKLERDDALAIARQMQLAKGVDPSLAIYAAYAYHDLQRPDLIRKMAGYMSEELGAPLFDLALLARSLNKKILLPSESEQLLAPFPLLAQGWTLLRAWDVKLPAGLQPLADRRLTSLWTMFDAQGVEQIRSAFAKGDIR